MLQTLKIYPILKAIINSVKSGKVTIISTPTSSGKTLAVPISLSFYFGVKVFATVPRVLLASQSTIEMDNGYYFIAVLWGSNGCIYVAIHNRNG